MTEQTYRVGELARICRCCRRTMQTWIDRGYLPLRRLPSGVRFVTRTDLVAFMKEHNFPASWLPKESSISP